MCEMEFKTLVFDIFNIATKNKWARHHDAFFPCCLIAEIFASFGRRSSSAVTISLRTLA